MTSLASQQKPLATAPYDEVSQLDLAKILETQEHVEATDQILREDVFDRRDDYGPPVELLTRSNKIMEHNQWGQRPSPRAGGTPPRP